MRGPGLPSGWITVLCGLALLAGARAALAQKYKPEDPIPTGATGPISPLSGKVTEIQGLTSALAGRTGELGGVLKDLGARVTEQEIRIELSADVLFDFDKADLRSAGAASLEKVATVLKSYPKASTLIEGHTDGKGSPPYNQRLSERRAASVKAWLEAHGVAQPLATRGWGERKPIAPNTHPDGRDDPEGRQKNRRVEVIVKK